jgi:hypothetical protein
MQSDQKAFGVSFGVLLVLGVAVLLFTVYMILNVPAMLQGTNPSADGPDVSLSRPSNSPTVQNNARAAQQLVQYRQRVAVLTQQVARYKQQLNAINAGQDSPPVTVAEIPTPPTAENEGVPASNNSVETELSVQLLELNEELVALTSQLDDARDAGEDLTLENIELESNLEALADEISLLEEVNQSIQELADRRRRLSIEAAAATLSRMEESPIPYLVECLAGEDVEIQIWGADVLGRLGPDAIEALPALRRMLDTEEESLGLSIRRAMDAIQGE